MVRIKSLSLISLLFLMLVLSFACSSRAKVTDEALLQLAGTWVSSSEGTQKVVYTFSTDNTGLITTDSSEVDFTFTLASNEIAIYIDNDGEKETIIGTYEIKDDKFLYINVGGVTTEYINIPIYQDDNN